MTLHEIFKTMLEDKPSLALADLVFDFGIANYQENLVVALAPFTVVSLVKHGLLSYVCSRGRERREQEQCAAFLDEARRVSGVDSHPLCYDPVMLESFDLAINELRALDVDLTDACVQARRLKILKHMPSA